MSKYFLGIDTSSYTTSLGVIDEEDNVILNLRENLIVKENQRGLRQQEMIFQHLNNFPKLIEKLTNEIDVGKIQSIAVTTRPRNIEDSYMPVFILGKNQAYILSQVLNTEYKEFSHQEAHIGAALLENSPSEFLSLHISGGTTELLKVNNEHDNLDIELFGGTLDISLGQLIDRIGVYLGYGFPSGPILDTLSQGGKLLDKEIPINIKDRLWTNLSGLENYFIKLIDSKEYLEEDIIISLFSTMGRILEKIIIEMVLQTKIHIVIITGGVSANSYIRNYLRDSLLKQNIQCIFPKRELSTDNGVGIAYLGKIKRGHREV